MYVTRRSNSKEPTSLPHDEHIAVIKVLSSVRRCPSICGYFTQREQAASDRSMRLKLHMEHAARIAKKRTCLSDSS